MTWLVDSNVLIYASKGRPECANFLRENLMEVAVSIVTYYEVLNYDITPAEQEEFTRLFDVIPILDVTRTIVDQALLNRQKKKIKLADNFILATAQVNGLTVATHNIRDFQDFVPVIDPAAG
jgi:predicted nucleic acid-binding protein